MQIRKIYASMDFPMSTGKLLYLQKRFLQSFLSLHQASTLLEMECKKKIGYPWWLCTVMHGYLLLHFILALDLDLTRVKGIFQSTPQIEFFILIFCCQVVLVFYIFKIITSQVKYLSSFLCFYYFPAMYFQHFTLLDVKYLIYLYMTAHLIF